METNLEQRDIHLIVAGIGAVLLISVVSYFLQLPQIMELILNGVSTVAGIVAAFFVYRGVTGGLGGKIGKATAILGFGIAYYTLTLIPHITGHIAGVEVLSAFLFQHVLAAWAFVLVAYGSYKFWRGGQK